MGRVRAGWCGIRFVYEFTHVLVFEVIVKRMFVDEHGYEAGYHTGQHQVENDIVAIGHFQHQDGGGKRRTGYAGQKGYHARKYQQVGIGVR